MKQRILTGLIAATLFIPLVILGGNAFNIAMTLLGLVGLYELLKMRKLPLISIFSLTIIFLYLWLVPKQHIIQVFNLVEKSDIVLFGGLALLSLTVVTKNKYTFDDVGFALVSLLYVTAGFYFMQMTRAEGLAVTLFPFFIIWFTDSGAYFSGMALGKHKLWPEISPKKTIEGFIGGIIIACIIPCIFFFNGFINEDLTKLLLITIVISIAGQFGDLIQSAFKRHYGIKDSGNILPGHGGILDRFDSLIFIMPIYFYIMF
jgi:phosphatidate cytidylyltransferase